MSQFLCSSVIIASLFFVSQAYLFVQPQTYSYNVTVQTANKPKFSDHKGNLKLYLNSTNAYQNRISEGEFRLTDKAVKLDVDCSYSTVIKSYSPLANITGVFLRWTLDSPYNPYYLINKPVIYFNSVFLGQIYYDSKYQTMVTQIRKFCPQNIPIGIKHADGANFYLCS